RDKLSSLGVTLTRQLGLFLETQTVACHTPSVIGDAKKWTERSAALITQGGKMHTPWKAEDIALLEKWCGIPGPAAPWLLTASWRRKKPPGPPRAS
ncbi:hypothetical protein FK513_30465, partial [Klebsiella pneumoniae]|nr:hypothetical protein [Klebsiella pneumoniae]